MQPMIEGERQVDTPQVPEVILPERLEDDPARNAMRDTGLDHDLGPGMYDRAPDSPAQRAVGVGVPAVAVMAKPPASGSQQGTNVEHELIKALPLRARPGRT
jgi:hypothetical protein